MTTAEPSKQAGDRPGVLVHPPVLVAGVLAAGLVLEHLLPLGESLGVTCFNTRVVGASVLGIGVLAMAWAVATFRAAGTNVPTYRPALSLVDKGPYAYSRNPIYLAGSLGLLGLAVALANGWLTLLALAVPVVLHFAVIRPEEAYLSGKFGEAYADYCRRVPRWLLV